MGADLETHFSNMPLYPFDTECLHSSRETEPFATIMSSSSSPGERSSETTETETLISSPPHDPDATRDTTDEIDAPDVSIHFKPFVFQVKVIKAILALGIPACIGTEIAHLLLWMHNDWAPSVYGRAERVVDLGTTVVDALGVGLTVSCGRHI